MKPSEALRLHRNEILRIAENARVKNVRVFGSTARGEDQDDSDLDLLVDATEHTSLFDFGRDDDRSRGIARRSQDFRNAE